MAKDMREEDSPNWEIPDDESANRNQLVRINPNLNLLDQVVPLQNHLHPVGGAVGQDPSHHNGAAGTSHSLGPEQVIPRPLTPPVNQQVPPPENVELQKIPLRPSRSQSYRRDLYNASEESHRTGSSSGASVVIPRSLNSKIANLKVEGSKDKEGGTVRERNATMLLSDSMADVWFVVGPPGGSGQERLPAHAYVLATGSSVFYAMFYGGFPKHGDVLIPDVDPAAFKILLRYLYTDEIDIDSETVLSTLYASKKYMVSYLTRACIEFLETSLTAKNVCLLLAQGRLFEEEELMQRCWELIDAQAEQALSSEGFLEVDFHTLEAIINRETLNCREKIIFTAAMNWAKAEARRKGLDGSSPEHQRSVLGSLFYQLRIPTMSIREFANGPAQSGLLTPQETTNIFLWFTADKKPEIPFESKARVGLSLEHCHRFQSSAYRSNQWRYRGRCDSIQFSADRRIFVAGVGLYGSSNGSSEYKVSVELKKAGLPSTVARVSGRFFSDGSSNVFPVYFEEPVQVEPDVYYTVSAVLDGSELSYFGQEGMQEVTVGKVNFQFQCSTESTNGTGVQGGQIPEILFYG